MDNKQFSKLIKTAESEDAVLEGIAKFAEEHKIEGEDKDNLEKFASEVFKLADIDTETLVKRSLGKLGDKPNQVDDFLAGIDQFIEESKMPKEAAEDIKVAAAVKALDSLGENIDVEGAAMYFRLFPQD